MLSARNSAAAGGHDGAVGKISTGSGGSGVMTSLPPSGLPAEKVLGLMQHKASLDLQVEEGQSRL